MSDFVSSTPEAWVFSSPRHLVTLKPFGPKDYNNASNPDLAVANIISLQKQSKSVSRLHFLIDDLELW